MGKEKSKKKSYFRQATVSEVPFFSAIDLLCILQSSIGWDYIDLCLQLPLPLLCKGLHLPHRPLLAGFHVKIYPLDISSYMSHCNPKLNRLSKYYSKNLFSLLDSLTVTELWPYASILTPAGHQAPRPIKSIWLILINHGPSWWSRAWPFSVQKTAAAS